MDSHELKQTLEQAGLDITSTYDTELFLEAFEENPGAGIEKAAESAAARKTKSREKGTSLNDYFNAIQRAEQPVKKQTAASKDPGQRSGRETLDDYFNSHFGR